MKDLPIAVLVSGSGTNLHAIIDSCEKNQIGAKIVLVLSNNAESFGLARAKKHGLPTAVIPHKGLSREEFEDRLIAAIDGAGAQLVCLAGFMRILTPHFINNYKWRVMNIHPALLPSFPGTHAQKQALDAGVKETGATVHFVDEGTDTGPIIMQAKVPVLDGDTLPTLTARILKEEHRIYPMAIDLFAKGKLTVDGRKVLIVK